MLNKIYFYFFFIRESSIYFIEQRNIVYGYTSYYRKIFINVITIIRLKEIVLTKIVVKHGCIKF